MPALTDHEFARFQRFIYEAAGITLSDAKKVMVGSRLASHTESLHDVTDSVQQIAPSIFRVRS